MIELCFCLLLFSILFVALVEHYVQIRQQYQQSQVYFQKSLELQAIEYLIRDSIRKAGFTPCVNIDDLKGIDQRKQALSHSIQVGQEKESVLLLRRMNEQFIEVNEPAHVNQQIVKYIKTFPHVKTLLLSDCSHAEVQVLQQSKLRSPLFFNYSSPFYCGELIEEAFFVRPNRQGITALFYRRGGHVEELLAPVSKFSASLFTDGGRRIVHLLLQVEKRQLVMDTRVRS